MNMDKIKNGLPLIKNLFEKLGTCLQDNVTTENNSSLNTAMATGIAEANKMINETTYSFDDALNYPEGIRKTRGIKIY